MSEKPQGEIAEAKVRAAFRESVPPTPDAELREKKRRAAVADTGGTKPNDKMIAALRRERSGLEAQGKTDRLKEVDAQLEHYGYEPDGSKSDGDNKAEARKQPPQGRSPRPQQTGDKTG